jgi:cytochrome c oxidase subunit 2
VPTLHIFAALWPLPGDASAHGPTLDQHLLLNLWIALGLLTLVHVILLTGLTLRRAAPAKNWVVEYLPLTLLALVFAGLTLKAERLWAATRYTGASLTALQVEVTGMQFAWYVRYPGMDATFGRTMPKFVEPGAGNPLGIDPSDEHGTDDIVSSELVLPLDREVDIKLEALDVMHGFAIPEMRLKQNAIPGQTTHLHFTPTKTGTYAILCTQLCGLGHYRMQANLRVVTPEAFAAWLAVKAGR